MGSQLEDARQLAKRYDRMRQDAEAQVIQFRLLYGTVSIELIGNDSSKS